MTGRLVLRQDHGAVAVLRLNRPDKLNALSPGLLIDLRQHLTAIAAAGDAVRVVVVEGAGRSFCAGADVEALKAGTIVEGDPEYRSETVELLGALPQVVIASVHGHCYTGGLELALAADVIVAAEDTRFCDTHAKLGIVPRWGLSARLPRRVGQAVAGRLSLTGEPVNAAEALRIGLCDYVRPSAEREAFVLDLATRISANVPASIAAIRHLYDRALTVPLAQALAYERAFTPPPAQEG